jgi:hypothetical protein
VKKDQDAEFELPVVNLNELPMLNFWGHASQRQSWEVEEGVRVGRWANSHTVSVSIKTEFEHGLNVLNLNNESTMNKLDQIVNIILFQSSNLDQPKLQIHQLE